MGYRCTAGGASCRRAQQCRPMTVDRAGSGFTCSCLGPGCWHALLWLQDSSQAHAQVWRSALGVRLASCAHEAAEARAGCWCGSQAMQCQGEEWGRTGEVFTSWSSHLPIPAPYFICWSFPSQINIKFRHNNIKINRYFKIFYLMSLTIPLS